MTVLNRPEAPPLPTAAPATPEPEPSRSRTLAAVLFALLAGFALAQGAVVTGLLLLAAAVTVTLTPARATAEGGAD